VGGHRVIAFDLVYSFFELFGPAGVWAPPMTVIVILVATQIASRESWAIRPRSVGMMYVEAVALSVPLLLFGLVVPLGEVGGGRSIVDQVALSLGAGIYEELVFRLVLISLVMMVGVDLLGRERTNVAVAAVCISSLVFAGHHYLPVGHEPFDLISFLFRTAAGMYLALVFWYRGYGPAAGCHAAYNVFLTFHTMLVR
jgi:hypothetical protein